MPFSTSTSDDYVKEEKENGMQNSRASVREIARDQRIKINGTPHFYYKWYVCLLELFQRIWILKRYHETKLPPVYLNRFVFSQVLFF